MLAEIEEGQSTLTKESSISDEDDICLLFSIGVLLFICI